MILDSVSGPLTGSDEIARVLVDDAIADKDAATLVRALAEAYGKPRETIEHQGEADARAAALHFLPAEVLERLEREADG